MKNEQLDDAWLRMQERMKHEPASAQWAAYAQRSRRAAESKTEHEPPQAANSVHKAFGAASMQLSPPADAQGTARRTWSDWLTRQKRWIAGTAAALVLGVTLATPAGNQVLASLLNQFRMEQITAVEQQDLEKLFNSIGASESTMNQYGEFAHFSKGEYASYSTIEELQDNIERDIWIPDAFRSEEQQNLHIGVSPSRTITMKVNVNEINDTMKRLGADKLLPVSIDGKSITLTAGRAISFDLYNDETATSYTLTQQPAPTVSVEAGVPLEEVLEAVLHFPLLPTQLKQDLQQSHMLNNGSAPLPVVLPDGYEAIRIANTKVLVTDSNATDGYYSAVWENDGQLFALSGHFPNGDALIAAVTEMIAS